MLDYHLKQQRFYTQHTADILCVAVHPSHPIVATGQVRLHCTLSCDCACVVVVSCCCRVVIVSSSSSSSSSLSSQTSLASSIVRLVVVRVVVCVSLRHMCVHGCRPCLYRGVDGA